MLMIAASSSKKRLNLSTPQRMGVDKRTAMTSPKTRGTASQRGRGRRGRPPLTQTPVSVQSTASEQPVKSPVGRTASRNLAESSHFRGHFTFFILLVAYCITLLSLYYSCISAAVFQCRIFSFADVVDFFFFFPFFHV